MWEMRTSRQTAEPDGFTLLEVLVSITILTIGLMASALLMSNTYRFTVRSRFMAEAAQLASEKLEDLNRFPQIDAHITVPTGATTCGISGETCEGSLTSDLAPQSITVSGATSIVNYSDAVFISTANGQMQETYQTAGGSTPQYATLTFSPNGQTPAVTTSTTAPATGETFDRRWVIEQDKPVVGVRRVTVLVTLMDNTIQPPITFQMSMVRP
jgi:prepilin-type N-terminal cleavage/methylation domain-containing protein